LDVLKPELETSMFETRRPRLMAAVVVVALFVTQSICFSLPASAQSEPPKSHEGASVTILLTIFLRHDQSKTLAEIEAHTKRTRFYEDFPPPGTEIVSWVVAMGVGQIVTLRLPPDRLRAVNRYIEERAWGAFRTEFYPTYDFQDIAKGLKNRP